MERVTAFFTSILHGVKEFFVNDATGRLDYRFLLGVWFAYHLGSYVSRIDHLSDWQFLGLCALQALYIYGPTADLMNYFKGIYGGFRTPDTAITTDTTQVDSQATTVTSKDINSTDPAAAAQG